MKSCLSRQTSDTDTQMCVSHRCVSVCLSICLFICLYVYLYLSVSVCLGVTALHLAVQRGNIDAVRCLMSAGADLDVVDTQYGHTALFYAIHRNDATTSELLRGRWTSSSSGGLHQRSPSSRLMSSAVAQPSKCSTDVLQPVTYHHSLPTCCLTGAYNSRMLYSLVTCL